MRIYSILSLLFYVFYNVNCYYKSNNLGYLNLENVEEAQLSSGCQIAMKLLSERLNDENFDDLWALQMLDSTVKMPTGVLRYNLQDLGNFDECIEIHSEKDYILGKYCLAHMFFNSSIPGYSKKPKYLKDLISEVEKGIQQVGTVKWAYCLPSNCSNEEAIHIISTSNRLGLSVSSVSCQTVEDAYPALNLEGIIGVSIFGVLFFLIIASTVIDLYCVYVPTAPLMIKEVDKKDLMKQPLLQFIDNNGTGAVGNGMSITKIVKPSNVRKIFVSFSAYSNGKRLFAVQNQPSSLSFLDGMRVLSMLWIMALHYFMKYIMQISYNPKDIGNYTRQLSSSFFISGALGCDTFFLVGGILVSYVFFKKDKGNQLSNLKGLLKYYLHRYIRLTPAMLGVVLFTISIFKYLNTGPTWIDGTTEMRDSCKKYWWSALLHIQNQVNVDQMCIRHSWYINVDMQLYLISPIILWILKNYTKTGIFSITVAALYSVGIYFRREYLNEMSGAHSTNPFAVFDNDYFKTETRAAPWLMGILLGYFLAMKDNHKYKLSKMYLLPLWILSLTTMVFIIIGGQPITRSTENYVLESALYLSLSRSIFALAVAWVIWACASDNGGVINSFLSLPVFNLLNKFVYSVYLLHLMVLNYMMFTTRTPIYFSLFELAYSYSGFVIISFVVSIIWVFIFEAPVNVLEKIILP